MHRKAEEEAGAEPPADDDNAARRRLGHAQQGHDLSGTTLGQPAAPFSPDVSRRTWTTSPALSAWSPS